MSSTATGDATEAATDKAAKRHGKKQPAAAKKTAAATAGKQSRPRVTPDHATAAAASAEPAATAVSDSPAEDPRSLAWMSARAVSALNAVQAHQAEKARELLARAEKPPIRHTTPAVQPVEHSETAATGKAADSAPPPQTVTDSAPPAEDRPRPQPDTGAASDAALPYSPDTVKPARAACTAEPEPARQATPAAAPAPQPASGHNLPTAASPAVPGLAAAVLPQDMAPSPAPAAGGHQHITPPAPAAAPRNRLPLHPAVLAGMLAVTGLLVYWSWPGTDDVAGPAAVQDERMAGDDIYSVELPQAEVISVVAGKPSRPPARPQPETATGQPAMAGQADPVNTTTQLDKTAPASATVAPETTTPSPAGHTTGPTTAQPEAPEPPALTTQPADPVPPARTTRPAAQQPRYPASGYGQGWQQPYYRPAYPRYPSR